MDRQKCGVGQSVIVRILRCSVTFHDNIVVWMLQDICEVLR